jgi:hypothetical protein
MRGKKVRLDKLTGRLTVSAEEHRDAEIEDDRERTPDHRVRMRFTAIALEQHVRHAGLDYNAGCPVSSELPEFFPKPRAGMDHGGHEIVERLPLHRDPFL